MASIQFKSGKEGKKVYYVVVARGSTRRWLKAGTLKDARILKREIEAMQASERVEKLGLAAKNKRIDAFFREYMERFRLRTSVNTIKRYRACLNAFLAYLHLFQPKLRLLHQITAEIIEDYQQKRLESVELKAAADGDKPGTHRNKRLPLPQTVNYEVGILRSAFIWAHERDLMPSVPTKTVKPLRPKPKRKARILTPDECKLFLATTKEMAKQDKRFRVFQKAFQFLLNTGLRSGELCNLTWDDVDLESGTVKIQPKEGWTPKSYAREIFLNKVSVRVLNSIKARESWVFKSATGGQLSTDDVRKVLMKVARAAGLKGFTRVHDLRHTFSSIMQMNGVDRGTVAAILGHRDLSTTLIYTHQTAEHVRKCIEKVRIA